MNVRVPANHVRIVRDPDDSRTINLRDVFPNDLPATSLDVVARPGTPVGSVPHIRCERERAVISPIISADAQRRGARGRQLDANLF